MLSNACYGIPTFWNPSFKNTVGCRNYKVHCIEGQAMHLKVEFIVYYGYIIRIAQVTGITESSCHSTGWVMKYSIALLKRTICRLYAVSLQNLLSFSNCSAACHLKMVSALLLGSHMVLSETINYIAMLTWINEFVSFCFVRRVLLAIGNLHVRPSFNIGKRNQIFCCSKRSIL